MRAVRGIAIDKRSLVRSIPVFSELAEAELDLLLGLSLTRELAPREVLFRKGDQGGALFGILEGSLRATTTSAHGKEVTFSVMGPGEVFGEIALFDGQPRSATVEAVGDARLIEIGRDDFMRFLDAHPRLAPKLLAMLARRVRRTSELVEDLMFMKVPSRLARRLLALARLFGVPAEPGVRIDMKLSAQDLGDLIGASGENVARQLALWSDQGVVEQAGPQIVLLRPEALEELADLATL
jgi:CRP-like cAMP-binding protein